MRQLLLLCVLFNVAAQAEPNPQRIVALAPHITEMLYAIGAGDRLVAVSDYSDFPSEAQTLPRVASYASVNIEAVLALKPDLVIAWRTGNPQSDIKRLQQFGVNVAFSDPITLEDIAKELRMIGKRVGMQDIANEEANRFTRQLSALRSKYQHKAPVPVFFAMGTAPVSTVANNAWPQQMLTLCAADNTFRNVKGDYPQVGIEQVVAARPEVIIQPVRPNFAADFSFWQRFVTLPAVQKHQFLSVNADYLYRTTPRTLLGIQQLCEGVDAFR
ncbi:cobalamin-binding protein [Rheinheimera baltica]|uniref:Cobalamin-binding protein n=1 Tax=Rheinheimera baltica TaxID=67576 RepID=A0ABT9HUJ2_9GAMM|nr:cobalamin-binding protein [Rheinheimera baltica]MDP5134800.1 cobalamin-binding protein [Rheinheimera baltica]MDP5143310.1 cobalamin-binding protein [Rheinheimera baltica]MDP5151144.1 cobalamin-binding protein [Rheinheimera baltica]